MPFSRIFDPSTGKSWKLNHCKLDRELRRGWVLPIQDLVPGVRKNLKIYVKTPAGADRDEIRQKTQDWWDRVEYRFTHENQPGEWALRPRTTRHKLNAHGWGRISPVGVANISSEQERAAAALVLKGES